MQAEFSKWAVVSFKDDTGLGRMATEVRAALGVGRHLVVPSERLPGSSPTGAGESWLKPEAPVEAVAELVKDLEAVLVLERSDWHPKLFEVCRRQGVKILAVPMWEWFRGQDEIWKLVDLFLCTSRFTEKILRSYGYRNTAFIGPWPMDLARFPQRHIKGPARVFIHNAGLVDHDDRKGTRDVIQAFMRVRRRDIKLIVRLQKEVHLPPVDDRVTISVGNLANPGDLYAEGDAAIQPSKMEGLGLMILEPLCAGLPVITTDYPPMNEYVRQPEMLVRKRWFRRTCFPARAAGIRHAHLRLPCLKDLARKIEWCAQNDLASISRRNRLWAEGNFAGERVRASWMRCAAGDAFPEGSV